MHKHDKAVLDLLRGKKVSDTAVNRRIARLLIVTDSCDIPSEDGGPGSGNWGHKGRIGKRGGSGRGGGRHNREGSKETGFKTKQHSAAEMENAKEVQNRAFHHLNQGGVFNRQWGWENKEQQFKPQTKAPAKPFKAEQKADPYVQNKNWLQSVGAGESEYFAKARRSGLMYELGKFTRNSAVKQSDPPADLVEACERKLMEKGKYIDQCNYLLGKSKQTGFDKQIKQLQFDTDIELRKKNGGLRPHGVDISFQVPNLTQDESRKFLDIAKAHNGGWNFSARDVYHDILYDNSMSLEDRANACKQFSQLLNKAMGGPLPAGYTSEKKASWEEPAPKTQYDVTAPGDAYGKAIASMRNPDRKYSADQLQEAGKHTAAEVDKQMTKLMESGAFDISEKYKALESAQNASKDARDNYRREVLKPFEQYSRKSVAEAKKRVSELEKEQAAAQDAVDSALGRVRSAALKSVIGRVRSVGFTPELEKRMPEHIPGKSVMVQTVKDAYDVYPTEWIQASLDKGPMKVSKISRGHYEDTNNEICISTGGEGGSFSTAIHELGHRFEYVFKNRIRNAEKEFYDRRTEGEPLSWLGPGYGMSQVTRKDHFIHPYMGKDYKGDAYELVSMGFDLAATNPQKLHQDPDYERFIYGLLTLA